MESINKPKQPSKKIPISDILIGGARGGPIDELLIRSEGVTLKQWVGSLHGWVKDK